MDDKLGVVRVLFKFGAIFQFGTLTSCQPAHDNFSQECGQSYITLLFSAFYAQNGYILETAQDRRV